MPTGKWVEFKHSLTTLPTFKTGKLIIFSKFADTASYLADKIIKEVDNRGFRS